MSRLPATALLTLAILGSLGLVRETSSNSGRVSTGQGQPRSPRILVLYDLEGASGVLSGRLMDPERPDSFAIGRESLISDVKVTVDALLEAGASTVDVLNTHGSLDPALVPGDRLSARVRVRTRADVNNQVTYHPDAAEALRADYDAVVAIGMHTKPFGGGFSPHTLGRGLSPYINGRTLTESELVGYSFGTVNIPVILVSGDDKLQRDLAESMPWVEYVAVKRSVSPDSVEGLPQDEARSRLRLGAQRAVANLSRMRPMKLTAPIRAGLLATFPNDLPMGLKNGSLPGIQATGDTVWFIASDYRASWMGIRVLMTLAQARNASRSLDFIRQRGQAVAALRELADSTSAEWRRVESGGSGRPR